VKNCSFTNECYILHYFVRVDTKEIGTRLRQYRKSIGYSQKEIAEKTGIGRSYIAHVENGIIPSSEFIIKLLNAFNISIDWLLTGKGKMLLPDGEHVFNKLNEEHIQFLEKITKLNSKKQDQLLSSFNGILDVE